jgi:hypothetical protein
MIIDTNVHLHHYPTRRVRGDEPAELVAWLKKQSITQAWAASFNGLLYKDLSAVNARTAEDCKRHGSGILVPFGVVNIALPGWQEDLRRCHEVHGMPGIRLYPGYHGYNLDDPLLPGLFAEATKRKLIIQIALNIEDERTQHRMLRVAPVALKPLPALLASVPGAHVMLLNERTALANQAAFLKQIPTTVDLVYDTAMIEQVEGVARAVAAAGRNRIALGSHAPFYYLDAALLKMREANLPTADANAVLFENAQRLLKW